MPRHRPDILIAEDEAAIRRLIRRALDRGDYAVSEAENAAATLAAAQMRTPDLVLLDLGLPDRDGLELVPQLARLGCAILVLTARDASAEKVAALDLGADDYVTKPFDTDELLARIRACLRHRSAPSGRRGRMDIGGIGIDLDAHKVSRNGKEVHLTPREFDLLAELARHAGRVLTHRHLLEQIWGETHREDIEYLRVAIRSLRLKLEDNPAAPRLIRNELGVGYRMSEE